MRSPFFLVGALFSFAWFSALAVAQSTGSSQSSSANAQQVNSPPSSSQTKPDPSAKPPQKKAKKVWTNEEVGNLKSTVSVVGDPAAVADPPAKSKARGSTDAERYRQQLTPLRAQLEDIERQIREVKSLGSQGGAYNNTSLDKLEDRRKAVQTKIDAVEEDARRHGFSSGDLR